jgi:TldD protein
LPTADAAQSSVPLPTDHKKFFWEKLHLTERILEQVLSEALSAGGEYADLYFEYVASTSLMVDESLVKSASQGISVGCGIRVLSGERTGFAYTDDLSLERLVRAARTAALIASGPATQQIAGFRETQAPQLYPVAGATADAGITQKLALIMRADSYARGYDPRIVQVRASFNDELRRILVVGSDGTFASDTQPLARMSVCAGERQPEYGARYQRRRRSRGDGLLRRRAFARALCP